MNKTIQWFKRLIVAFSLQSLSTLPVEAQSFILSPVITITTTKGGQSRASLNVTNNASEPLRVRVYAESFSYEQKQGFMFIPKDSRSAVPYINFSPRELVIAPGVTRNVRVAVTLPSSLPNQEYRAAVLVEELRSKDIQAVNGISGNQKLSISFRVASVFFFSKGSDSIANIQTRTAIWNTMDKKVAVLIENSGKQTASTDISWRIEKNGQIVAKNNISGLIIQAENSREIVLRTKEKSPDLVRGEYRIVGDIVNGGQKPITFNLPLIVP
jgi:hypothetical protein